jgi:hypothetical protein
MLGRKAAHDVIFYSTFTRDRFYSIFGSTVVFSRSPQMAFSSGERHLTMVTSVYIESKNAIAVEARLSFAEIEVIQ